MYQNDQNHSQYMKNILKSPFFPHNFPSIVFSHTTWLHPSLGFGSALKLLLPQQGGHAPHVVVVVGAGDENGDQQGVAMERTQAVHAKEILTLPKFFLMCFVQSFWILFSGQSFF